MERYLLVIQAGIVGGVLAQRFNIPGGAVRPENCICCMMCELRCPDLTIEVLADNGDSNE